MARCIEIYKSQGEVTGEPSCLHPAALVAASARRKRGSETEGGIVEKSQGGKNPSAGAAILVFDATNCRYSMADSLIIG
jgi:hypothetical protein